MKTLTNVWSWLDGKKRVIGIIVIFIAGGLFAIKAIDQATFDWLVGIGGVISTIDIAHAFKKGL